MIGTNKFLINCICGESPQISIEFDRIRLYCRCRKYLGVKSSDDRNHKIPSLSFIRLSSRPPNYNLEILRLASEWNTAND